MTAPEYGYPDGLQAIGLPSGRVTRDANGVPFDLMIRVEALRAAAQVENHGQGSDTVTRAQFFERYLRGPGQGEPPPDPRVAMRR